MTVKKRRDAKSYKCIEHRIADVRNGALVIARGATSGGWILPEGALLFELSDIETAQGQKGSNIFRVLPCVKIAADAEATATKVKFAHGSCSFQGAVFPFGTVSKQTINVDGSIDATLTAGSSRALVEDEVYLADLSSFFEEDENAPFTYDETTNKWTWKPGLRLYINGTEQAVSASDNIITDVWVIATANAPVWIPFTRLWPALFNGIFALSTNTDVVIDTFYTEVEVEPDPDPENPENPDPDPENPENPDPDPEG